MTLTLAGCAVLLAFAWHHTHPVPSFATPYPLYGPRSNTMPGSPDYMTDYDPDDDTKVGEIAATPENPILADPDIEETVDVLINRTLAGTPNGHHAIKLVHSGGSITLTAGQAHQLHIALADAAEWVSGVRQDPGYES